MMRSTTALEAGEETPDDTLESFYASMPRGYSLFGDPRPLEEEKQAEQSSQEEIVFDDDECENITLLDLDYLDKPYDKYDINILLKKILEKNNFTHTKKIFADFTDIYHVYTHKHTQKTVALFSVVKDREDEDHYVRSLDEVLGAHSGNREANNKIIIPMLETIIPHYRLITLDLDNNLGLYHDSKSPVASATMELGRAIVSVVTQRVAPATRDTCGRHFYNITLSENPLNHQAFYNVNDTGAYLVAYADLFLQGVDLQIPVIINIEEKKAEYHQLLYANTAQKSEEKNEPPRFNC
jgi:hypothetical protein